MKRLMLAMVVCLAVAGSASATEAWTNCTPVDVATYAGRVHVRCSASVGGGIFYFGVSTADSAFAQRFVSIGTAALVAGRPLSILYEPADTSGTSFGCASNDCRRAKALVIK